MRKDKLLLLILFTVCLFGHIIGESFNFIYVAVPSTGLKLNDVCYLEPTTDPYQIAYIAVGDGGIVYRLNNFGRGVADIIWLGDSNYILSAVSFAPSSDIGYIVGYDTAWRGKIWKTTNRGLNWDTVQVLLDPPFHVQTPFLNVKAINGNFVWVSCGNGFVIFTRDGGHSWWRTSQNPAGSDDYFGWFWGLWAPDTLQAYLCADQSRHIFYTWDQGSNWIDYRPFQHDSFAYYKITGDPNIPENIYIAASNGRVVFREDDDWDTILPIDKMKNKQAEWVKDVFYSETEDNIFLWCVGTGGTVSLPYYDIDEGPIWYSNRYNLYAIDGGAYISTEEKYTYVTVGSKSTILCVEEDPYGNRKSLVKERTNGPAEFNFWVQDAPNDHGWNVEGGWEPCSGARYYRLYVDMAPECNLLELEDPVYIGEYDSTTYNFTYDGVLTSYDNVWFKIEVWGDSLLNWRWDTVIAYDNRPPSQVQRLRGEYNPTLDAAILKWYRMPSSQNNEPNLGGYWVCPEIYPAEYNINHPAPLYRNYYIEKPPYWAYGHNWGFWVQAMDRSGNRGPWSESVLVYIPGKPANSPYATAFTQGRHLVRTPNSKETYMTFESEGKIYLSLTTDEGENWETEEIDNGLYPCIGINYKGQPWIAYCKDGDLVCKMKREDGSWKEILIFDGDENHWAGPPSMQLATMPIEEGVIDYAYITYPVYDGSMPDNPGPQPPSSEHSYIYVSLFDTTGIDIVTHLIDEGPVEAPVSHPCVGVTPADLIHICWQREGEIWYITNTGKVTPENWREVEWTSMYNISDTKELSEHPFIETYGDEVFAVWSEGEPGEIIRRPRVVSYGYDEWGESENLSNSPEFDSDYPQMSTGAVILWQEEDEEHNYKIYANILGNVSCLTPEAQNVSFVHTNALIDDPQAPTFSIYYCYTDEITEDELYEVKFDKYEYQGESGNGEFVYYEGKLGEELASTYCEQRTGYIDYGNYKIDYGNNHLKYKLKYLNPCKKYLFQGILYQCTTATIQQKLEVEDTLASDNTISYAIPETISFFIRKNSYKEDLESKIKINKIQGAYSVLAKFKLYEYETIDSMGGSGPQSAGLDRLPIPTMLYSPKPNPFNNQTEIRFQIPVKTKVDLKVYNSAGRLVNTLVSDEMNSDYYTINWNGKDNQNRTQSNGIYFVRLKTNDYDMTKKLVMVK